MYYIKIVRYKGFIYRIVGLYFSFDVNLLDEFLLIFNLFFYFVVINYLFNNYLK